MTENMGPEPRELPLGTPPPMITPPEGVVISRVEGDGWTRKYLYQSRRAMGGDVVENSLLIAEIPPMRAPVRREVPLQVTPVTMMPQNEPQAAPQASGPSPLPTAVPVPHYVPPPTPPLMQTPQLGKPMALPGSIGAGRVPGRGASSAFSGVPAAQASLSPQETQRMALSGPTETVPAPRQLRLSQSTPPPSAVPPAPCPVPPGPMQLPNGKIIQLDDPITLGELWEILPYLAQQCAPLPSQMPPQQQPTGIPTSPIGAGFPGFGPATGMFGTGGFIGQGGGGGGGLFGPLGQISSPVPQPQSGGGGGPGPQGPAGPAGPAGAGSAVDFVTKVDGDFTAGPGAFIPVPGTTLSFTQGATGPVVFLLNACFGCNDATNNALAINVDGTVIPLQANLWHTFVGGVGGFFDGSSAMWPMMLAAGSHTVFIMLRGISAGEFCSGTGLGFPATVAANPQVPLSLAVLHQGIGTPAPGAPVFVVDGLTKTDGNFTAIGALTAVPSTQLVFSVTSPGNVQVIVSADFAASPFDSLPSISLGIIVDGGPPQLLATMSEQIGAGADKVFTEHLTAMIVLPNMAAGPHSIQMAYASGAGAPAPMTLVATPTLPATLSVVHP